MAGLIDTELTGTKKNGDVLSASGVGYDPEKRSVAANELVSNNLDEILKTDSPLLQRARARAAEQSNARGLINSTMGAQAGETAMIDAALPIASADAGTYNLAARENQAAGNTALQFGATATNQAAAQNVSEAGMSARQIKGAELEAGLIGSRTAAEKELIGSRTTAEAGLIGARTGAEKELIGERATAESGLSAQQATQQESITRVQGSIQSGLSAQAAVQQEAQSRVNAELESGLITTREQADARLRELTGQIETGLVGTRATAASGLSAQEATQQEALARLRGEVDTGLQTLRGNQAKELANIEAQYKGLMQANASAAALFNESMQQMATILRDPNTSAEQKSSAVDGVKNLLQSSLEVAGAISDLDLGGLLNFSGQTPTPA